MTVLEVLRTLWHRRVLTLVGLVGVAIAMSLVAAHQDVYWSQANVVFLEPTTDQHPNSLTSASASLVATAGYVEKIVNAGGQKPATAANVTLLGRGVRDGYTVDLPDSGGQWSHNFEQAMLSVQVTGPSEAVVRARLDRLVARIRTVARDIQVTAGVPADDTIRTDLAPTNPGVNLAGGSRIRAVGATALLGLGLTVSAVLGLDRLAARRSGRPRPPRTVTSS
ncbi:hypothetical protein GEV29_08010 [Aeromicrobium sp. SMF47]|uniref:Uncharacterized protein n=1 Tax=Aeromicrobium yanjiei TaxID=2662028 RepID=A0A5Q2MGT6_9ACTN|nr:hypothetical protein [Aeromicrobium yanjiei]MRJ76475.1 hypothetical protein [Aeromicrobium yanjiei]QGG42357.1 hypothetical protein GEV26_13775 [Aeromicrobium yanjiei]